MTMKIEDKTILIHGFSDDEVINIMNAVKKISENPVNIAFSMTTQKNLNWKVKDLIKEVRAEHDYILLHPPGKD